MDVLGFLASAFPILAIASLLVIVIGFLNDSNNRNPSADVVDEPPSRSSFGKEACYQFGLSAFWCAYLVWQIGKPAPIWELCIIAVLGLLSFALGARALLAMRRFA